MTTPRAVAGLLGVLLLAGCGGRAAATVPPSSSPRDAAPVFLAYVGGHVRSAVGDDRLRVIRDDVCARQRDGMSLGLIVKSISVDYGTDLAGLSLQERGDVIGAAAGSC